VPPSWRDMETDQSIFLLCFFDAKILNNTLRLSFKLIRLRKQVSGEKK